MLINLIDGGQTSASKHIDVPRRLDLDNGTFSNPERMREEAEGRSYGRDEFTPFIDNHLRTGTNRSVWKARILKTIDFNFDAGKIQFTLANGETRTFDLDPNCRQELADSKASQDPTVLPLKMVDLVRRYVYPKIETADFSILNKMETDEARQQVLQKEIDTHLKTFNRLNDAVHAKGVISKLTQGFARKTRDDYWRTKIAPLMKLRDSSSLQGSVNIPGFEKQLQALEGLMLEDPRGLKSYETLRPLDARSLPKSPDEIARQKLGDVCSSKDSTEPARIIREKAPQLEAMDLQIREIEERIQSRQTKVSELKDAITAAKRENPKLKFPRESAQIAENRFQMESDQEELAMRITHRDLFLDTEILPLLYQIKEQKS